MSARTPALGKAWEDAFEGVKAGVVKHYRPPGPVAERFQLSPSPVKGIMGPYGSGKTTTLMHEATRLAVRVPRNRDDGIRYAVGLCIRDTYRNLERNTLKTWAKFIGPVKRQGFKGGGGGEPATHQFRYGLPGEVVNGERRQNVVDLTMIFAALGEHSLKEFMDGFEPSFILLNGMDALPRDVIQYARGRVGRTPDVNTFEPELLPNFDRLERATGLTYTDLMERAAGLIKDCPDPHILDDLKKLQRLKAIIRSYARVCGDMNAPDLDNWAYEDFEGNRKEGYRLFRQPGGRSPQAENLRNLPPGYYENMCQGAKAWWIRRFVDNKFGYSREGEPVYEHFDDQFHVSRERLTFYPDRKLIVGIDTDRSASAVFMQKDSHGQIRVLGECVPPGKEGAKQFGRRLRNQLAEQFPDAREILGVADPAGDNESANDDNETWIELCANMAGIDIIPAETNDWNPRFEALNDPIMNPIEATRPGLLLSGPDCPKLSRALMDGYRYKKKKQDEKDTHDRPDKNRHSHVAEAAQYGAMHLADMTELLGRDRRNRGAPPPARVEHVDPLAGF